jgi:hypothetical protein
MACALLGLCLCRRVVDEQLWPVTTDLVFAAGETVECTVRQRGPAHDNGPLTVFVFRALPFQWAST